MLHAKRTSRHCFSSHGTGTAVRLGVPRRWSSVRCNSHTAAADAPEHSDHIKQFNQTHVDRSTLLRTSAVLGVSLWASTDRKAVAQPFSIADAVARAEPGSTIRIPAGRYTERLVIDKGVTLEPEGQGPVELVWETSEPYQSVVQVTSSEPVTIRGLAIRHYSKSVANNYAVFVQAGSPQIIDCSISSRSGSGVGIEGATPLLQNCTVSGCERHGIAVFASFETGIGGGEVVGCSVQGNKLDGVLVRDGAVPAVHGCSIVDNGEWGVEVKSAGGSFSDNVVKGNRRGAFAVDQYSDVLYDAVAQMNHIHHQGGGAGAIELLV